MSSWKDTAGENLLLCLKIYFAFVILRGVFLLLGYTGYIPVIDDSINAVLDFFQWLSGASGNFVPRI